MFFHSVKTSFQSRKLLLSRYFYFYNYFDLFIIFFFQFYLKPMLNKVTKGSVQVNITDERVSSLIQLKLCRTQENK